MFLLQKYNNTCESQLNYNYEMLRAFVQYTLNVDLNAPVIKDLVEKYKDIEQFNRSITDKYVCNM